MSSNVIVRVNKFEKTSRLSEVGHFPASNEENQSDVKSSNFKYYKLL